MGQLDYLNSYEWALQRGIINICAEHNCYYDPRIGCPACLQEQQMGTRQSSVLFWSTFYSQTIVTQKGESMGSKGRHNVKKPKQEKDKKQEEKKTKK